MLLIMDGITSRSTSRRRHFMSKLTPFSIATLSMVSHKKATHLGTKMWIDVVIVIGFFVGEILL